MVINCGSIIALETNGTNQESSLKSFSILILDRNSFGLTENTIIYLLERIRPDLEEPEQQEVSFPLIRTILSQ